MRKINVAAPHPMICARLARFDERRRLRIVDHHEFRIQRQPLAILLVVGQENIKVFLAGMVRRSMQRVVKCLGYLKKILASAHDLPFNIQVQLFRQRHQASENFRYATANGCRIDHLDTPPEQRRCQSAQLLNFTRAKQLGIVIERYAPEGQDFTHAFSFRDRSAGAVWRACCPACSCKYQCCLRSRPAFVNQGRPPASARSRWSGAVASAAKK